MNLFEQIYETFKFPKGYKIKLFEAFAGIGCQRMGMDKYGIPYESVGISEIDKYALKSYEAIHGNCENFGSITEIKGKDLPQIDIFTYSFPCTDLSKAGKQKGLNNTRSGLVYEVLRILQELNELQNLPRVLIMENVVDLVQSKFIKQFNEIQFELEKLGYTNYVQKLNSKNYGVAQNRDRVFMVSILEDYYYEFPKPFPLEKRLKDYLEDEVDERYYLSEAFLNYCLDKTDRNGFVRSDRFNPHDLEKSEYAFCITTNPGNRPTDNYLLIPLGVAIPEATSKGYAIAKDGGGIYIDRPHQKRGVVQDGMIPTLKTSGNDIGIVGILEEKDASREIPLIVADEVGTLLRIWEGEKLKDGEILAFIRKLTPLEVYRFMGIGDEAYHKAAKAVSRSQRYKQAGNGIVVDVIGLIIKQLVEE